MYYKYLDDEHLEIIKKIQEITMHDYELKGNFIPQNSLWLMVEDLLCEVEHFEEMIEEQKENIKDNYIPRPMSDYTGDNYDDRY